jgi:rhamnogalacturonyl hydrolase YesR
LQYLPKEHASYKRYELLFRKMANSLKERQAAEGFWHPNLDDPKQFTCKESSGIAFFTYGLAWGINYGVLDKNEYLPVVQKAWKALADCVNKDGKVEWGQRVGDRPALIKQSDTHEFVSGIFLLAASEVHKLNSPKKS